MMASNQTKIKSNKTTGMLGAFRKAGNILLNYQPGDLLSFPAAGHLQTAMHDGGAAVAALLMYDMIGNTYEGRAINHANGTLFAERSARINHTTQALTAYEDQEGNEMNATQRVVNQNHITNAKTTLEAATLVLAKSKESSRTTLEKLVTTVPTTIPGVVEAAHDEDCFLIVTLVRQALKLPADGLAAILWFEALSDLELSPNTENLQQAAANYLRLITVHGQLFAGELEGLSEYRSRSIFVALVEKCPNFTELVNDLDTMRVMTGQATLRTLRPMELALTLLKAMRDLQRPFPQPPVGAAAVAPYRAPKRAVAAIPQAVVAVAPAAVALPAVAAAPAPAVVAAAPAIPFRAFCRRCGALDHADRHNSIGCRVAWSATWPAGGFIKASTTLTHRALAGPNHTTRPLSRAARVCSTAPLTQWRTLSGAAGLSNAPNMFGGASTTAYLDSGNQTTVVTSAAVLENVCAARPGQHLRGAVEGSQMLITHTGDFRLTPEAIVPAVVCPEAAANLVGMLCVLNATPHLGLVIGAAAKGEHVCKIIDERTAVTVMEVAESMNLLPFELPAGQLRAVAAAPGAQLPDADQLPDVELLFDNHRHALLCLVIDLNSSSAAVSLPDAHVPPAACMATSQATRVCSQGFAHGEYADYWAAHEEAGHVCDAELKSMMKHKLVAGLKQVRFPPRQLPCATCLLAKGVASRVARTPALHRVATRRCQILRIDNIGPIFIKQDTGTDDPAVNRYLEMCFITDVYTGCSFWLVMENKAQTADNMLAFVAFAHRLSATEGGVEHLEIDNGTDVVNAKTVAFARQQGFTTSNYAPGANEPRGGIERPHQDAMRKLRAGLIEAKLPLWQWYYLAAHARRLLNLTTSSCDITKSKHEAFYHVKPSLPHRFGCPVVTKLYPKPTVLKPRAIAGRWFGFAGDMGHSVHMVLVKYTTPTGMVKTRVVRSRHVRFLSAAQPDGLFTDAEAAPDVLDADDPILLDSYDAAGRAIYAGPHGDTCVMCKEYGHLYMCDYCPKSYCLPCSGATLPQLRGEWRCPDCRARDLAAPLTHEVDEPLPPAPVDEPARRWAVGAPDPSSVDEPMPDFSILSSMDKAADLSNAARRRLHLARKRTMQTAAVERLRAATRRDQDAVARARAARAAARVPAAVIPGLRAVVDGSDSDGNSSDSDTDHPRRLPAPRLRGAAFATTPSLHPDTPISPAPEWLLRTRAFGGVPLTADGIWVLATTALAAGRTAHEVPVPSHYNMATTSADWPMWKQAIDAELAQLEVRKAFTAVLKNVVGSNLLLRTTWVFTVKDDVDSVTGAPLLKFKARLTARGDLVDPTHINPDQLNAPTIDPEAVRLILALVAADPKCKFIQSDIVAAYLNVVFKSHEAPIFVSTPQGMDGVPEGHVLQLHINLYGLCEAAWRWYMQISETLADQGWTKSSFESCLWHRKDDPTDADSRCFFLLHVDDSITIGRKAREHYDRLASRYQMKDLGLPTTWCGIQFTFLPDVLLLHQTAYKTQLVHSWRTHPTHPMHVTPHLSPMNTGDDLRNLDDLPAVDAPWYPVFCGQLGWLLLTCPDLTPASTMLFRGLNHVTPAHVAAAEHILGYISATLDTGLTFDRTQPAPLRPLLEQHLDAEYGRNRKTGRADEGQMIKVNGNLISWSTSAQTSVAGSSYHAEIIAFADGTMRLMKIRNYILDLGLELDATPVYEDNNAVIRYGRDIGLARAARSLVQKYHYGRDLQQQGYINLLPVRSADNLADFFTKIHSKLQFRTSVDRLGIRSVAACIASSTA